MNFKIVLLSYVVLRLNGFQGEEPASTHAEANGSDAPIVDAVYLGADFRRADAPMSITPCAPISSVVICRISGQR